MRMRHPEQLLPRAVAATVLVVSIVMLAPLGATVITVLRGGTVAMRAWLGPLVIMATGLALLVVLARPGALLRLYLTAFALWLMTAVYLLMRSL
jgi:hypothetical protein